MAGRSFLCSFFVAVAACSHGGSPGGGAGHGGDQGGSAGDAGGAPGGSGGTSPSGGAGGVIADAAAPLGSIGFSVVDAFRGLAVRGKDPVSGDLPRVELPARFTIRANAPDGVRSVAFTSSGGSKRVDGKPPFRLTETDAGEPAAWPATERLKLEAIGFASEDGTGEPLARGQIDVRITTTGIDVEPAMAATLDGGAPLPTDVDAALSKHTFSASNGLVLPYRLHEPAKAAAELKYPLLVFLHGSGQRGNDNAAQYAKSQLFMGPRSIVSAELQRQFPSFVLVPQCARTSLAGGDENWGKWVGMLDNKNGSFTQAPNPSDSGKATLELIDELVRTRNIDPDRIYLAGESMGGIGVWDFTPRRPTLFAAGVPMAGYSDKTKAAVIAAIPFWVFHGGGDFVNPTEGSRQMAARLREAGGTVRYTEYPGLLHQEAFDRAWTSEDELLPWLFSMHRTN